MEKILSKELLSILLKQLVVTEFYISNKTIVYTSCAKPEPSEWQYISIYEIAHLCKLYAVDKQYTLSSCVRCNGLDNDTYEAKLSGIPKIFYADTEVEAVYMATAWVYLREVGRKDAFQGETR